jgi:hypothetical protein
VAVGDGHAAACDAARLCEAIEEWFRLIEFDPV